VLELVEDEEVVEEEVVEEEEEMEGSCLSMSTLQPRIPSRQERVDWRISIARGS
jgi:hypothetical protein